MGRIFLPCYLNDAAQQTCHIKPFSLTLSLSLTHSHTSSLSRFPSLFPSPSTHTHTFFSNLLVFPTLGFDLPCCQNLHKQALSHTRTCTCMFTSTHTHTHTNTHKHINTNSLSHQHACTPFLSLKLNVSST